MTNYIIFATYVDSHNTRCPANRNYALGEYARAVFRSKAEAEKIIEELKRDIGSVVDASIEYDIEGIDSSTFDTRTLRY